MVAGVIGLNVVIYLIEQANFDSIVSRFALWPIGVHAGQWYRLLTSAFLHANIEHIAFNMVTLAIVGPPVEVEVGRARFGVVYLLAALGGSVASYLLSPANQLGLGASGAIFGVMGAYFVLARCHGWEITTIGVLIGINLVFGFAVTNIDWRAHLGGLLTGAVVTVAVAGSGGSGRRRVLAGVATSAVTLGVLAALVQLPPGHVNL